MRRTGEKIMGKKLNDNIEFCVTKELEEANKKFPAFNSTHEGYAVILEGAQETEDEMRCLATDLNELWRRTKINAEGNKIKEVAAHMEDTARRLAAEATQTAAMSRKLIQYIDSTTLKEAAADGGQDAAQPVLQEA